MSGWSGKNYIIKTILFFLNILITRIQTHLKINSKFGSNILKLICWIIWDCSFKTKGNSSLCVYTLQKKTFCHCIRTFFVTLLQRMVWSKAVLYWKLKGAQCSEPVKSRVPSIWFVWKIWDFLVAQEQKLGARNHRALLEHSAGEEMQQKVWYMCIFVMDWINISLIHLPGIKFSISFVSLHIITVISTFWS